MQNSAAKEKDIYMEYANIVKRFLISLSGNADLAEDLTQETFYQAYKSIHRYNGNCKMSVWLCQIAKHVYFDYLKKKSIYRKWILKLWIYLLLKHTRGILRKRIL